MTRERERENWNRRNIGEGAGKYGAEEKIRRLGR